VDGFTGSSRKYPVNSAGTERQSLELKRTLCRSDTSQFFRLLHTYRSESVSK
jgi:hypothetical protein